jgi:hypothetical protein
MPLVENYSKLIVRTFHATPSTVVLRVMPSPQNSRNRYPEVGDVRVGTIYGASQFDQQEYITGTLSPGGGGATVVYPVVT